jgi:hypothetical protein
MKTTINLLIKILTILILIQSCRSIGISPYKRSSSKIYSPRYMAAPAYYEMSDGVYRSSETSTNYLEGVEAGTLTAGEQNDFGKWNLWTDIAENDLKKHQDEWKIYPLERFTVQVINSKNNPVIDCSVELLNDLGKTLWLAKTDNTGKAELWDNLFKQDSIERSPES